MMFISRSAQTKMSVPLKSLYFFFASQMVKNFAMIQKTSHIATISNKRLYFPLIIFSIYRMLQRFYAENISSS